MLCMNRLFQRTLNALPKRLLEGGLHIRIRYIEAQETIENARYLSFTLDEPNHPGVPRARLGSLITWTFDPELPSGKVTGVRIIEYMGQKAVEVTVDLNDRGAVRTFWRDVERTNRETML